MSIVPPSDDSNTPRRKALPKRVRFEVLRRDNYTCRYCHKTDTELTVDHVTPVVLGGTDDPSNLVAACKDCNAGKTSSNPDAATVAQVGDDAIRWSAAMQEAAERATVGDAAMRERTTVLVNYWDESIPTYKRTHPRYRLPADWALAFDRLLSAGLPEAMICDSIDVAISMKTVDNAFRYMLGVANNKLAKLHEVAASIVSDEDRDVPPCSGHTGCECEATAYYAGHDEVNKRWRGSFEYLQHAHLRILVDRSGLDWLKAL